jgi:transcriptional regulator of acetoin/glycerol metabolism
MLPPQRPKDFDAALREARRFLLARGEVPSDALVGAVVARSWARSHAAGLSPDAHPPEFFHLAGLALAEAIDDRQMLLAHARPVMEYLHAQTRDSGSMVILADDHGVLLESLGDAEFLDRAGRVALAPGASWHERDRGTNAIGTALAEASAVVINGAEHFLDRNDFLTCAAAPVSAPDGRLLGVLDISGDHRRRHPHTLSLVHTAAQMLENRIFEVSHRGDIRLHLHPLAEGVGTVAEGLLAVSEDARVLGANRAALALLALQPRELGTLPLERVLHVRWLALLEWARQHGDEPVPVSRADPMGRPSPFGLFVRVSLPPPRPSLAPRAVPAGAPADALAALDTGCMQLHAAVTRARKVLDKPIPVLLQGESGVGKEVFAQAMHASSMRRERPFVAVDCASLPENLIEAELFGYAPGAFTGARREGAPGRIREVRGGTLFLDEIGDMPLALQTRLLRVLQERQVTPLGGGKPVPVEFALVCATHRNLKAEMDAGRFRADLYYRLNGLTLMLPAVRDRTDFPALLQRLLTSLAPDQGITLAPAVAAAFADHPWPGNVRQLVNALRTACALLDPGERVIDWSHLPDDLLQELRADGPRHPQGAAVETAPAEPGSTAAGPAVERLRDISAQAIHRAIEVSRGNMSEAARRLGISRNTLYRRLTGQGKGDT